MLAFVVLINPIAGNGVVPEKPDFYCKQITWPRPQTQDMY